VPFPVPPHRRRSVPPAALLASLLAAAVSLAGCSAPVPGHAGTTGVAVPTPPAPSRPGDTSGGSVPAGACQITISGPGRIRVSGASNRVTTINGASSLSCGGGPVLAVDSVADGAVTLSADGAAPVRIAAGESADVESYKVTVTSADGAAAQFVVAPG
jgi:hypothetical protein